MYDIKKVEVANLNLFLHCESLYQTNNCNLKIEFFVCRFTKKFSVKIYFHIFYLSSIISKLVICMGIKCVQKKGIGYLI